MNANPECNPLLAPTERELIARAERWKGRALAFQEGYRDKSFEITALEIQIIDLKANGVDKITRRQNESLKTKMLAACIDRNDLRDMLDRVIQCFRNGATPHQDIIDEAEAVLESTNPRPKRKG